jgi:hypothetical protein
MADALGRLVEAIVLREFEQAVSLVDSLIEQQYTVQQYHAHDVTDSTQELFRREAKASDGRSLDKLAIDGVPDRVRSPETPEAEPPERETLDR